MHVDDETVRNRQIPLDIPYRPYVGAWFLKR